MQELDASAPGPPIRRKGRMQAIRHEFVRALGSAFVVGTMATLIALWIVR